MDETLAMELSYVKPRPARRKMMAELGAEAAAGSGVSVQEIRGDCRIRAIVYQRQAFFAAARDHGHSLSAIGRWCGGRNHSTVAYGADRHNARGAGFTFMRRRYDAPAVTAPR